MRTFDSHGADDATRSTDPSASVAEAAATHGRHPAPKRDANGRFIRRAVPPEQPSAASMVTSEPAGTERAPEPGAAAGGGHAAATVASGIPFRTADSEGAAPHLVPGDEPTVTALRPEPGMLDDWRTTQPIRIVLVEDVPEVAAHIREVLRPQSRFKLVHVVSDGRRAADEIGGLEPDVVIVDSLLQGRTSAPTVVERLRTSGSPTGIVALTLPDHPVEAAMSRHADAVVTLPFGTLDLARGIISAHAAHAARDPSAGSRTVAVFSAKGGVGKTTIAFNLAASLAATGLRTLLLDGSLQFGDVRRLLRADPSAPSICDVPTDCVRASDLDDAVMRDSSGVDVLLAPPRPELADLVTGRDVERVLDVLQRSYQVIVIDTPASLGEPTLGLLDAADLIIDVLTADAVTLECTRLIGATFVELGYPAAKVRYLVNRFDSVGAVPVNHVAQAIGREPDYTVASDWRLVSSSNAEGVPFVLAAPGTRASADVRRVAESVRSLAVTPAQAVPVVRRILRA